MSVAMILQQAGFSPQSPHLVPKVGDAGTLVAQGVPKVPSVPTENNKGNMRAHLLELAKLEAVPAALVHGLMAADVDACEGLDDETLRCWLDTLPSIAKREAGRTPPDYTARALCAGCGAVNVHPGIIESAPMLAGWPRLPSCPWCLYRLRTGKPPPRPAATCGECLHFQPSPHTPRAGMGQCTAGHPGRWARERHACRSFTLMNHEGNRP